MRVLVVDDSSEVRAMYRRIVEGDDEIELVGEAANGREALDMVDETDPDVIVMDVHMPVLDGVVATRMIKERRPEISVLGCSASDDDSMGRALTDAGAAAHIDKAKAATLLVPIMKAIASSGPHLVDGDDS